MSYPGVDYNQLAQKSGPATGQLMQGVDPDWTALAQAYGFRQNPFPAAGTEGQDQLRFLATLKNIMDAQLGGPNGRYAQMSPGNPSAAMPFGMANWMQGAGNIFNSLQGRMLMPLNQADMFGGGYQFGGIDTSGQSGLQAALATARSNSQVGQIPYNNPNAAPAPPSAQNTTPATATQVEGANTPAATPPASQAPATSAAQANTGKTSSQVSGMPGDVGQQGAGPGAQTGAQTDIIRGLMQQPSTSQGTTIPGVGTFSNDQNGLIGMIQNLPPERKAMIFNVLQALMTQGRGTGG